MDIEQMSSIDLFFVRLTNAEVQRNDLLGFAFLIFYASARLDLVDFLRFDYDPFEFRLVCIRDKSNYQINSIGSNSRVRPNKSENDSSINSVKCEEILIISMCTGAF